MCGIVGYIGTKNSLPILLEGLKRLEYRGYDSAGIALSHNGKILVRKRAGKVAELVGEIEKADGLPETHIGMGHTRWATHGEPNDINAHPHLDCTGGIAVIHNGIIENYASIKTKLAKEGHTFKSATDTEIVAHLIEEMFKKTNSLFAAVRAALREVKGTYGLVVLSTREPQKLIAARMGSPLIIGVGDGESFVAADAAAIIEHTRQVVYLNDGEVAEVTASGFETKTIFDVSVDKEIEEVTFDISQIERGGYEHFMIKEINEQPETIRNAMRGRLLVEEGDVKLGGLQHVMDKLLNAQRFIIIGCGTSWHAGLVGEYLLEQIAKVPTEVEYASEFRYRNPVINKNDVVFLISQSGETADTLAAMREARSKGATVLGIVNVVGSTIARESQGGVYVHAGPEIGVASTKAFTSQLTTLALITLMIARAKGMPIEDGRVLAKELDSIPAKVSGVLQNVESVRSIAGEFKGARNFLFLGRGSNFPVALEGALKLKEISYIHAEGYPAAEMKHGPIALIDEHMPVVFVVPRDSIYEKVISNVQEVKARKGRIIAIANEDDSEISGMADHVIRVPRTYGFFGPIINVIPLQLLAYYMAVARGCNVDQPRNLAKSVTVE
ncbi:MAG: glutamine--fructose-6-phosphate transaminase (isomerizing) [Ignavibacteriales bacterium]|nr:glutamine--fructose-6-phosphate transaminase (isomerizing) [Ignavibacteriales bacterium]